MNHESQLAGQGIASEWGSLTDEEKDAYVRRLAANAHEPPDLLTLLAQDSAAETRWRATHFLVRAEFCAFINEARFQWQRKWRAKTAIKAAPKETPYRRDG